MACDYAYVEVDDGSGWTAVPGSITIPDEGNGIDGLQEDWVAATFDLSAYAGSTVGLRVRYVTDGAAQGQDPDLPAGIFVDNIVLTAGAEVLLEDGAETGGEGWTLDGFTIVGAEQSTFYDNYYIASNREYIAYDRYLQTGPYNFGFLNTRPDWVEHFPYQDGLLIWYWDTSYSDNDVGLHPGEGEILPIDAHPRPICPPGRAVLARTNRAVRRDLRVAAGRLVHTAREQPAELHPWSGCGAGVRRPAVVLGRAHSDNGRQGAQRGCAHPRPRGDGDIGADPDHINGGRGLSPSRRAGWEDGLPARSAVQEPSKARSRRTTVTSTRRLAMARSGLSLLAVLLLGLAAACGSDSSDADSTRSDAGASGTPTPETTTRPPLSSVPPPTMTSPPKPPTNPSDQVKPVTVSGTVSRSDGCVDLVTSTVRWSLLGAAAAELEEGAEVEIYGAPMPQLQSACGDNPLDVREVRPR